MPRLPIVLQNLRKLPGFSGMVTVIKPSLCSPNSARSETYRKRSKFILAPLLIATRVLSFNPCCSIYFLIPATASAPAGSVMERVSSKISLIAAHISSVLTVMTSSTHFLATLNVSRPTCLTATPSAKIPT